MAIIDGLRGVDVTIRIDGQTATEYADPDAPAAGNAGGRKTSSQYIECKDKAKFAIHLRVTKDYAWGHRNHSLNISIYIDGEYAKGELCREGDTLFQPWECDVGHRIVRLRGNQPSQQDRYVAQAFEFSGIKKVDDAPDERVVSEVSKAKKLGLIEIKFFRCVESGGADTAPQASREQSTEFASKALKGKATSHMTRPTAAPNYIKCSNLRADSGPIAIFRFIYRSKEGLVAEAIIPRPPRARSVTLEGLSEEQIRTLATEALERRSAVSDPEYPVREREVDNCVQKPEPGVKQEIKQEPRGVKRESGQGETVNLTGEEDPPPRPYKVAKTAAGKEVVDLLDDD
ncbi:hypothetical protein DL764_000059 [Monosporascus ibericus]|uniref:DUF7918 domain-containing protein n=1 Tax=Monosporascus ibericus TaxID=155417 RepID=A0A4Q4TV34_9PEZI|nr:hypothetical protein DL764_000059 [Monosporascus ibericus]